MQKVPCEQGTNGASGDADGRIEVVPERSHEIDVCKFSSHVSENSVGFELQVIIGGLENMVDYIQALRKAVVAFTFFKSNRARRTTPQEGKKLVAKRKPSTVAEELDDELSGYASHECLNLALFCQGWLLEQPSERLDVHCPWRVQSFTDDALLETIPDTLPMSMERNLEIY